MRTLVSRLRCLVEDFPEKRSLDLDEHDRLIYEIETATETMRRLDPISALLRGEWRKPVPRAPLREKRRKQR
jgi:hypothetical protein